MATVVKADYRVPFLAHAAMEPLCCTVQVDGDHAEVWTGVQDPLAARKVAAKALGLDAERVHLTNLLLGGGFGRRLPGNHDYIDLSARIAKAMSPTPVNDLEPRRRHRARLLPPGGDGAVRRCAGCPRHASQHGFFKESFIDELAYAAKKDPYAFRRDLLSDRPRFRAALDKAAAMVEQSAARLRRSRDRPDRMVRYDRRGGRPRRGLIRGKSPRPRGVRGRGLR